MFVRVAAVVCLLGVVALAGVWIAHGTHLATRTQIPVEKTFIDDFGDEETVIEWKPAFELGLDYGGPAAGALLGLGGVLLFVERRRRR